MLRQNALEVVHRRICCRHRRRLKLPWSRGPAGWRAALAANEAVKIFSADHRNFHSLRTIAQVLHISTQPLRDWNRLGYLRRDGPRGQFSRSEVIRFLVWLKKRAKPFRAEDYLLRIFGKQGRLARRFNKLRTARFVWPKGRHDLVPMELAVRIRCHASLIVKAIRARELKAHRRTRCRWGVTRREWDRTFPGTLMSAMDIPPLPDGPLTVARTALYLRRCGVSDANVAEVRRLVQEGYLHCKSGPQGTKVVITRTSLKKYQRVFAFWPLTASSA